MVLPAPHPLALFSLVPANVRAKDVVDHPDNEHLVSLVPDAHNPLNSADAPRGLNIGFQTGLKSRYTLATLGRNGDIFVQGSDIARIHCSFEIYQDSEEIVMLQDKSNSHSTQTFGTNAMPFEVGRPDRRVVVAKHVNDKFGIGGVRGDLIQFAIHWHKCDLNYGEQLSYRQDNPRYTRTLENEIPTAPPSQHATRIHTLGRAMTIRYYKKEKLGQGSFGEVWKAVDVDAGKFVALKLIKWPEQGFQSKEYKMLKQEVECSASLSHPNIVEFISAQGWGGPYLEIFTRLKDGNIQALIHDGLFIQDPGSMICLLRHMLQALDHIAFKGIIHRDVKPENILYTYLPAGGYTFQLTDFGVCNAMTDARMLSGSPKYMAPEFFSNPGILQTPKVDVWSLFVTLAEATNVDGFQQKPFNTNELRVRRVAEATNNPDFGPLRDMVIVDPSRRASAGEMLDKLFNGEGRSTPRNEIRDGARLASTAT